MLSVFRSRGQHEFHQEDFSPILSHFIKFNHAHISCPFSTNSLWLLFHLWFITCSDQVELIRGNSSSNTDDTGRKAPRHQFRTQADNTPNLKLLLCFFFKFSTTFSVVLQYYAVCFTFYLTTSHWHIYCYRNKIKRVIDSLNLPITGWADEWVTLATNVLKQSEEQRM